MCSEFRAEREMCTVALGQVRLQFTQGAITSTVKDHESGAGK